MKGRLALGATGLLTFFMGCMGGGPTHDTYASDLQVVQVTSSNVQGKNVYIPSTLVVTSGATVKLSVFNTTDTPHGFSIAGLGIEEVLPVQKEHEIELTNLQGGNVYRIHCQLHPPHRSGTLVVLHGN